MTGNGPLLIARTDDIATCLALRRRVFIEEQSVPEHEEVDGRDGEAVHLLATCDGVPVGCARLLATGGTGKIGRVCVLPDWRGRGIGAAIVRAAVGDFAGRGGIAGVKLGAQTHAIGFYAALGFTAEGPEYLDAGIAHRDMWLQL
jgi:predicted GNAT family N-acyltransferase